MDEKEINREKTRYEKPLCVPMTKAEKQIVEDAAKREGMTKTAYSRAVFNVVSKISLAKLIVLVENEIINN